MRAQSMQVVEEVLERLLWEHGLEREPSQVRAAVTRGLPTDEGVAVDGYELVSLAGEALGLRVTIIPVSVEVLERSRSFFPLYCSLSEEWGWLGVLERRRGRYRIVRWRSPSEERWVTRDELLAELGVGLEQELNWLVAEPAEPLLSWSVKEPGGVSREHAATVWPRLRGLLLSERKELWSLVLYAMGIGIFSLATPIAVQSLVNTVAFGTLLQPLIVLTLMLAAGLVFLALMQAMQIYLAEMISRRVFARVVADFAYRLPRIQPKVFEKKSRIELANYFFDVLTVQKVSAVLLFDGLTSVLVIGSGLLLLALYHPVLLVFDVLLVLAILGIIYLLGRGAIRTSIQESKGKHKTAAWLNQMLNNPLLFKAHGGAEWAQSQAEVLTRNYLRAREQHFSIVMRQVSAGLIVQVVASTGLLLAGGWLVINQQLTLGQLVAAELIVSALVASLFKVVKMFEKFYDLMASLDKLGTVIDLETESAGGEAVSPVSGPISIRVADVSATSSLGRKLLDKIHFSLDPGTRVAIVGSNLEGKSALADLLFGLRKLSQGQIWLHTDELRDLRLPELRQKVALVRELSFVEGSILENLCMGGTRVGRAQARLALQSVGLWDEVAAMPQGMQTHLMNDGFPLTARQKQQLALARAIATQPNVLIVDGVLDTFAPEILRNLCQTLCSAEERNWTLLFLTNRTEVTEYCDVVWSLETETLTDAATEPNVL